MSKLAGVRVHAMCGYPPKPIANADMEVVPNHATPHRGRRCMTEAAPGCRLQPDADPQKSGFSARGALVSLWS